MAHPSQETAVAILIDCDNVPPDIVDFALRMAANDHPGGHTDDASGDGLLQDVAVHGLGVMQLKPRRR